MRTSRIAFGLVAIGVVLMMVGAGYAFSADARTYNQGNTNDMQFITIGLGDTQYSSAVDSEITYRSDILIDSNGRSGVYVPEHDETITVTEVIEEVEQEVEYDVTKVVQFDITLSKQGSDPMPTYTLIVSVDDTAKMNGTFFVSYWTDPLDDNKRTDLPFPGTVTITGLTTQSIKFVLYVHEETSTTVPQPPLDDIAFKFRTTVGV